MRVNFLTGSLVLRRNKTGVHNFHEQLICQRIIKDGKVENTIISCYASRREMEKKYPEYKEKKYSNNITFSHRIVRVLSYLLPIEVFFGRSDIYFCDGLIPITLFHAKRVAVIHDLMVKIYPDNYSIIKRIYLNIYFKRCRAADLVVTPSNSTKLDIIKYLNIEPSKIKVIGCSAEIVANDNCSEEFRNKVVGDGTDYIFYIGDMRKNKNLLNAIRGFELALRTKPELRFLIAGSKNFDYTNLHTYVELNHLQEKVIFLGYISDSEKSFLFKNGTGLLFVSAYEGFGIPVIEAAKYGVPAIVSNTSSLVEIADGYYPIVNPNSADEIAHSIIAIQNKNIRKVIIENGNRLAERYTWDCVYQNLSLALNQVYD